MMFTLGKDIAKKNDEDIQANFSQTKKNIEDLTKELKLDIVNVLTQLRLIDDNIEKVIVNAHNMLCNDIEEMDFKLEKIHGKRYNNDYRRGKRKTIYRSNT